MPQFGSHIVALLSSAADENVFMLPTHSISSIDTVTLRRRLPKTSGRGVNAVTSPLSLSIRRDKTFAVGDTTKLGTVTISTVAHPGMDATAFRAWVAQEISALAVEIDKGAMTGDITLDAPTGG